MESSNFNGADGTAVKVRCKLGKIFNSTSEENTVCLWSKEIPQKLFQIFKGRPRQFKKLLPDGLDCTVDERPNLGYDSEKAKNFGPQTGFEPTP
jgi:hypothetical protein